MRRFEFPDGTKFQKLKELIQKDAAKPAWELTENILLEFQTDIDSKYPKKWILANFKVTVPPQFECSYDIFEFGHYLNEELLSRLQINEQMENRGYLGSGPNDLFDRQPSTTLIQASENTWSLFGEALKFVSFLTASPD